MKAALSASLSLLIACLVLVSCDESTDDGNASIPEGHGRIGGHITDNSGAALAGVAVYASYDFYFGSRAQGRDYRRSTSLDSVELTSFTAVNGDGGVILNWSTASEDGASHFLVTRDHEVIAQIAATNSAVGSDYTWTDNSVESSTEYYYELLEVTLDGQHVFLASVTILTDSVAVPAENTLLQSFPNPVAEIATIRFALAEANHVGLTVQERHGSFSATLVNANMPAGVHYVDFDTDGLANGFYDYRLVVGSLDTTLSLLRNDRTGNAPPMQTTGGDGSYSADVAVGDTIPLVNYFAEPLGYAVLRHVRVTARKTGYQEADSVVSLNAGELRTLDLVMEQ